MSPIETPAEKATAMLVAPKEMPTSNATCGTAVTRGTGAGDGAGTGGLVTATCGGGGATTSGTCGGGGAQAIGGGAGTTGATQLLSAVGVPVVHTRLPVQEAVVEGA